MALLIRGLRASDTAAVVDLYRRTAATDPTVGPITAESWERFVSIDFKQGGAGFLVAQVDTHVVGLATSSFRRTPTELVRHFRIIVEPAHRRQGIGQRLLKGLIDLDGDTAGVILQSLCPEAWRPGRSFLEHFGFDVVESELEMRCDQLPIISLPPDPRIEIGPVADPGPYAEAVARLHNQAYSGDVSFVHFTTEAMATLLSEGAQLWLACMSERVVGFCHLQHGTGETWLESIVVDPAVQGRRVGTRLALAVLTEIVTRRSEIARLQVSDRNVPARRLYQALGFVIIAQSLRFRAQRDRIEISPRP